MLSSELWDIVASIDHRFQFHVDLLCASDARAVREFHSQSAEEPESSRKGGAPSESLLNTTAQRVYLPGSEEEVKDIQQEGYVAPNVILVLIDFLFVYDQYFAAFPFLAAVLAKSFVEFLGMFVDTTADLVLGERALKNNVLEKLTPLHYSVTSQAFSLLSAFIPRFQTRLLNCLDLVSSPPAADGEEGGDTSNLTAREKNTARRFLVDQLNEVVSNCTVHQKGCLSRITRSVLRSVASGKFLRTPPTQTATTGPQRGAMAAAAAVVPSQAPPPVLPMGWGVKGHEWVLRMLTEVAKVLRVLRPLLPSQDVDAVAVPIIGAFAIRLQEVTKLLTGKIGQDVKNDVLVYKANVEKFGYDVLAATKLLTVESVLSLTDISEVQPHSTEEETFEYFFSPAEAPQRSMAKP